MKQKKANVDDVTWIRKWVKRGLSKDKRTLDLSYRRFDLQIAMDIAENLAVPGIEIIYLHDCWIKDAYLEEMVEGEIFSGIRELWMHNNIVRDVGAGYLADCDKLDNLRHLCLYSNKIGAEGAQALAESQAFSRLEVLDLSFNKVGDRGAIAPFRHVIRSQRPVQRGRFGAQGQAQGAGGVRGIRRIPASPKKKQQPGHQGPGPPP